VYFFLAGFLVLSGPHPVRGQSKALHPVTVGSPKPDFTLPVFQGGDIEEIRERVDAFLRLLKDVED
jgi:hypothetical protein